MESQANVIDFAGKRRARPSSGIDEYKFRNMHELLAFVGNAINDSGLTYKTIASNAHVCASTVGKLAAHQTRSPHCGTVFSVLAALGWEMTIWR